MPLLPAEGEPFDFSKMTDAIKNFQFTTTQDSENAYVAN